VTIRVVQWTTGNVGKQAVQAIMGRQDLELVGCYAWSSDKVGKDVGELCGSEPIGRGDRRRVRRLARSGTTEGPARWHPDPW
jgi:hypothetical protein